MPHRLLLWLSQSVSAPNSGRMQWRGDWVSPLLPFYSLISSCLLFLLRPHKSSFYLFFHPTNISHLKRCDPSYLTNSLSPIIFPLPLFPLNLRGQSCRISYSSSKEDMLAAGDLIMCRYVMRTEGFDTAGALRYAILRLLPLSCAQWMPIYFTHPFYPTILPYHLTEYSY